MNIRFEPVAWLTGLYTLLLAVIAGNETFHLLPQQVSVWVAFCGMVLGIWLGARTRGAVTPLADPKAADGRELVPSPPARVPYGTQKRLLDATIDDIGDPT